MTKAEQRRCFEEIAHGLQRMRQLMGPLPKDDVNTTYLKAVQALQALTSKELGALAETAADDSDDDTAGKHDTAKHAKHKHAKA